MKADASLVVLSEKIKIKEIITIDSDYYVYWTIKKEMIENYLKNPGEGMTETTKYTSIMEIGF